MDPSASRHGSASKDAEGTAPLPAATPLAAPLSPHNQARQARIEETRRRSAALFIELRDEAGSESQRASLGLRGLAEQNECQHLARCE